MGIGTPSDGIKISTTSMGIRIDTTNSLIGIETGIRNHSTKNSSDSGFAIGIQYFYLTDNLMHHTVDSTMVCVNQRLWETFVKTIMVMGSHLLL